MSSKLPEKVPRLKKKFRLKRGAFRKLFWALGLFQTSFDIYKNTYNTFEKNKVGLFRTFLKLGPFQNIFLNAIRTSLKLYFLLGILSADRISIVKKSKS